MIITARTARTVATVLLAFVLAACAAPTSGHPVTPGEHDTGTNGTHGTPAATLAALWQHKIDGAPGSEQQLVSGSSDGKDVYVSDVSGHVWALSATDGKIAWTAHPGSRSGTGVGYADGMVFYYDSDAGLFALDAHSGKTVWHMQLPGGLSGGTDTLPVAVTHGILLLPDQLNGVEGVRVRDGKVVWRNSKLPLHPILAADATDGYVIADDSLQTTAPVQAIDPLTGRVRWTAHVARPSESELYAYATGSALVLLTMQRDTRTSNVITTLQARTGKPLWNATAHGLQGQGPPILDGSALAFAGLPGVVGFDAKTGKQLYSKGMDHGPADTVSLCGANICSAGLSSVVALDAEGHVVSSVDAPDDGVSMLTTTTGPLIFVSSSTVYAFSY